MRITFKRSHLSIVGFESIVLPEFVLITGPNGSGKTHFLQAISNGAIDCGIVAAGSPNFHEQVRYFDWNSLIPKDEERFSSETIRNEKISMYHIYDQIRNSVISEEMRRVLRHHNVSEQYMLNVSEVANFELARWHSITGNNESAKQIHETIGIISDQIRPHIGENTYRYAKMLSRALNKSVISLTQSDFNSSDVPIWGEAGMFQQSFARLFVAYRDIYLGNSIRKVQAEDGEVGAGSLSKQQLEERYGVPPWDFVNKIIEEAELDFVISKPAMADYVPYVPVLTKRSTGAQLQFSALSSGEKIIMSFAFSMYYAIDDRQITRPPKIILLDEVDAPLHPYMAKTVIKTITDVLVGRFKIKVIATSHSPSTVALAPEESIYTMAPGAVALNKITKSDAISLLLADVPAIAVSFHGRRQVFVESPTEARTYEKLYKAARRRISSDRTLEFIPTGTRDDAGKEQGNGCGNVIRIVNDLARAGNDSVFGLVDWDGKNTGKERIFVLAENNRYSIENVILDPLLIVSLIVREFPSKCQEWLGIDACWADLMKEDQDFLQSAVDVIIVNVLGGMGGKKMKSRYAGDLELDVEEEYLLMRGHDLGARIIDVFPFLKSIVGREATAGKLMHAVIEKVIWDHPSFLPLEILSVMEEILNRRS